MPFDLPKNEWKLKHYHHFQTGFIWKFCRESSSLNGVRKRRLTAKETSNGFKTRRHAFCPKQANTTEGVVLNMYKVCIWGVFFFSPKQGQGFNPPAVHLYPNIGRVPAGIQSRSLVKWAIKLKKCSRFRWIAHKRNKTEHQGQGKRGLTYCRLIMKSVMDNFPAKIKGPCWVHRYKTDSLGTGSFRVQF